MHMYLSRVQQKFLGKANERLATYLFLVVSSFEWKEDIREYQGWGNRWKKYFSGITDPGQWERNL